MRDLTEGRNSPEWAWRDLDLYDELLATEKEAWERDHPGAEYPEHECALTDREYTDLHRWRRQQLRRSRRSQ
jgi:hypothetical protein